MDEYEPVYLTCFIKAKDIMRGDPWIPIRQLNARLEKLIIKFYEIVEKQNYSNPDSLFWEPFTIGIDIHYNTSPPAKKMEVKKKENITKVIPHQIKARKLIKVFLNLKKKFNDSIF
jgi:hypothetical protein